MARAFFVNSAALHLAPNLLPPQYDSFIAAV